MCQRPSPHACAGFLSANGRGVFHFVEKVPCEGQCLHLVVSDVAFMELVEMF